MNDYVPNDSNFLFQEIAFNVHKPLGINIKELRLTDIGRGVVYRTAPNFEPQQGTITSFNDKFIFVSFGTRTMRRGEACAPEDLEFMS